MLASVNLFIQPAFAGSLGNLTDTTPPVVTSFDFIPKAVDVTSGDANIDITMHVTDDLSGFSSAHVYFYSPTYGQYRYAYIGLTSGSPLDADVQGTLTMLQDSEAGDWSVNSLYLYDNAGNSQYLNKAALENLGFPVTLAVTSDAQDVTPPQLNSFDFAPASIDVTSGQQSITFTMGITDSQSGLDFCQRVCYSTIYLQSPSGKQTQYEYAGNVHLQSGTPQDGVWQVVVTLPKYAEAGLWKVQNLYLYDITGNSLYLNHGSFAVSRFSNDLYRGFVFLGYPSATVDKPCVRSKLC